MNFYADEALAFSNMGISVVDPATFIRYEVVPVAVRPTHSADFPRNPRMPYRFHLRVLRSSPEGTVMSVFSPLNREWTALVNRVATLIRDLRNDKVSANAADTTTATAADGTTVSVSPTPAAVDPLANVDFGDEDEEGMDTGRRMTVSGRGVAGGEGGITDQPWFWPVVILGGVGAFVYFRK